MPSGPVLGLHIAPGGLLISFVVGAGIDVVQAYAGTPEFARAKGVVLEALRVHHHPVLAALVGVFEEVQRAVAAAQFHHAYTPFTFAPLSMSSTRNLATGVQAKAPTT